MEEPNEIETLFIEGHELLNEKKYRQALYKYIQVLKL